MSRIPSFTKFPGELIVRTLQFCNSQGILRFSATCRNFHELVRSTTSLQLQIELEANRLQLADKHAQDSQHELLEALERYRDNWLDLQLDLGQTITLTPNERRRALIRLQNGLFANVYSNSALAPGPFRANAIEFIPLDEPAARWNITSDVVFHQFAMDSSQDLIVLASIDEVDWLTLTLRLCSLKTGFIHALAEKPAIVLKLASGVVPCNIYDAAYILVAGKLLVVNLISNDTMSSALLCDVLIIDWHAGVLLHRLGARQGFCNTTYLGNDRLAIFVAEMKRSTMSIPIATSITLLLFDQISTPRAEGPRQDNDIYDISACPMLSPALDLKFPAFQSGAGILVYRFHARSAPAPGNISSCNSKFVPDPWCQILSLTMRVVVGRMHRDFTVFVDAQRILRHLPRASLQTSIEPLPWQAWGEDATRWIETHDVPNHLMCSFHGSRFVTGQHTSNDHKSYLIVADFNAELVKKLNARKSARNSLGVTTDESPTPNTWPQLPPDLEERRMLVDIVDEGTPTVIQGFTKAPFVSRLPYRVAVVGGPSVAYDDWMIGGNRLIGLEVSSHSESNSSHDQLVVHYVRD